jgi:hypothetical protein
MDRRSFIILAPLALAACGATTGTRELGGIAAPDVRDYNVVDLDVTVPRTLEVSEQNLYYPGSDIVWRGEPMGDRYEQVQAIFEDGMGRGVREIDGSRDVRVAIEVRRFHSLTEKARYTTGGVHSIRFIITVYDAGTGNPIEGPRLVAADLDAYGGDVALQAERAGQTQRVRVTDHLSRVIQQQLGDPVVASEF